MKVIALKPFSYSADGITVSDVIVDDEPEIPDDLVSGLVKEGFVSLLRSPELPLAARRKGKG